MTPAVIAKAIADAAARAIIAKHIDRCHFVAAPENMREEIAAAITQAELAAELREREAIAKWHDQQARQWRNCTSEHRAPKWQKWMEIVQAELHEVSAQMIRLRARAASQTNGGMHEHAGRRGS